MPVRRNNSTNHIQHKFLTAIATCLGIGFVPKGSGTAASLVAAFFWWGLMYKGISLPMIIALTLVFLFVGTFALIGYEKKTRSHDSSEVVIDEWVGMGISLWIADPNKWFHVLLAFILFRVFDIWKPPGVRYFDRHYLGGWGVMLDDVVAGIYAAICLGILQWLFR